MRQTRIVCVKCGKKKMGKVYDLDKRKLPDEA